MQINVICTANVANNIIVISSKNNNNNSNNITSTDILKVVVVNNLAKFFFYLKITYRAISNYINFKLMKLMEISTQTDWIKLGLQNKKSYKNSYQKLH